MPPEHAQHLHCPHCGYDLTGLTEHRCPECGEESGPPASHGAMLKPLTFGDANIRMMWLPAVVAALGAIVPPLLAHWKAPTLLYPGALFVGLAAFIVVGLNHSHRLARALAISRATAHDTPLNERQVIVLSLTLFFCQAILSLAAFMGGCTCGFTVLDSMR